MACIYKIVNEINGHLYIGQTSMTIQERWRKHLDRFKNEPDAKGIYDAMRNYGIENFHCEVIEQCEEEELNEKEVYWIAYYDTFHGEGYNLTAGGDGSAGSVRIELPKEEIIALYQSREYSMEEIAKKYGCSDKTISNRLKAWGVEKVETKKAEEVRRANLAKGIVKGGRPENFKEHIEKTKKKVARLNKNGEIEKTYSSLSEACRDLGQSTSHTNRITAAIEKGGICFGYHWVYT